MLSFIFGTLMMIATLIWYVVSIESVRVSNFLFIPGILITLGYLAFCSAAAGWKLVDLKEAVCEAFSKGPGDAKSVDFWTFVERMSVNFAILWLVTAGTILLIQIKSFMDGRIGMSAGVILLPALYCALIYSVSEILRTRVSRRLKSVEIKAVRGRGEMK